MKSVSLQPVALNVHEKVQCPADVNVNLLPTTSYGADLIFVLLWGFFLSLSFVS